jgi:hypothetical protein
MYEQPPRRGRGCLFFLGLLAAFVAGGATLALIASPAVRGMFGLGDPPPSNSSPSSPSPTQSSSPTPSPTPTPTPTVTTPGIGDPVRDGKFEFVVQDVVCDIDELEFGFLHREPHGQFCVVEISVENIGDIPWVFTDTAQYAEASDGTRENASTRAGIVANEGTGVFASAIGPGDMVTGKLVFDIPEDTTLSCIELHDSIFSSGIIVTVD